MTHLLLDGNVLVALTVTDHVHHDAASRWITTLEPDVATCPITEGTLIRFLMRSGHPAKDAITVLDSIRSQTWHTFWSDDAPYTATTLDGVLGHRQVTDAYLVALARAHRGRVATLDRGLAAMHGHAVELIPS